MSLPGQNSPILWIITFSLMGSVGAICLAGSFLLCGRGIRQRLIPHLLSYAIGTLLGAAFLGLIPHALDRVPASQLFPAFLAGIVFFLLLERLLIWRHCHNGACEVHPTSGVLILVGDAMHNFVDGVLIAATFLTSIPLGVATSLAIISHEVPQEVVDFAILLDNGYSTLRAFVLNIVCGTTMLAGALLAFLWLPHLQTAIPWFMALSAAGFVYVSMADLVPSLHRCVTLKQCALHMMLIVAGMATIGFFHFGNHAE